MAKPSGKLLTATAAFALLISLGACRAREADGFPAAKAAFVKNDYSTARDGLLRYLGQGADNGEARVMLARVLLELGDSYAAQRAIDQLQPGDIDPTEKVALNAHSLILRGQSKRVPELLESSLAPEQWTASIYRMLLWSMAEGDNLTPDDPLLAAAIAKYPSDAQIHALAARAAFRAEDFDRAAAWVAVAQAAKQPPIDAGLLAGELALRQGDLDTALQAYQAAHQAYPDHAVPAVNVAGILMDQQRTKEADKVVKQGLARNPHFPLLHFQAARVAYAQARYPDARAAIDKMGETAFDYVPATLLSGQIAIKLGMPEFGRQQLSRAAQNPAFRAEAEAMLATLDAEL